MYTLKEGFMALLNKKIIAIFLIMQLSIAFFSIVEWIIIKNNGNQFMGTIKNRIDVNNLYLNPVDILPNENSIDKKISDIDSFISFLENNNKIEKKANYLPIGFMIKENSNIDYDRLDGKLNLFYNGMYSEARLDINAIAIDQKSFEFFDIPISSGRKFNKEDYYDSENTIIIGDGLKEFYSVGDKIRLSDDIEYEIIGCLPQGYSFFGGAGEGVSRLNNMDMSIIKTLKEDNKTNIERYLMFTTTIMKPKGNVNVEELCKEINQKAKEVGLNIKTNKIANVVKDNIESLDDNVLHLLIVSVIIIVFSVISIVFTMVNYIMRRKREFGIRLACGSSIYKIIKLVVVENLILFFISGLVGLGCYYKKYHFSGNINNIAVQLNYYTISIPVIIYFIIFIFIICMIACIIPIIKIKKLSPKDLIGGVE